VCYTKCAKKMQPALDGCPLGGTHNNVYTNGLHSQGLLATKHMLYSQLLAVCTGTVNQENATAGCPSGLHQHFYKQLTCMRPTPLQKKPTCPALSSQVQTALGPQHAHTPQCVTPPQTHCSLNRYWRAASTTVSLEQATDHLHPQLITEERPHCQTRMCNPTGVPLPKLCPAATVLALSLLQGYYLLPPPTGATPGGAVLCCS
jgi:hypothetical protein